MCPLGGALIDGEGGLLRKGKIVAHCLLIEAGGELVLVDTGYGTEDCASPGRLGVQFRLNVMPQCRIEETAVRQVEGLGHDPKDVRHLIATHLDRDHAGGLGDFPDAQVHAFADELAAYRADAGHLFKRYLHAQTAHGPNWVEHRTQGDSWFGFESVRLLPDLDAEIALIPLPGHSAGMCGVAINTAGGWLLHCADAFFFRGEIETPRRCTPVLRVFERKVDHDTKARFENLERLQELQRDHGDEVTLICSHDAMMLEASQATMKSAPGRRSQLTNRRKGDPMDQPTAEEALKRLEPLVGQWKLEAIGSDGQPWPGEASATIEWHDSRAHIVERSHADMPEAPDGISIMGCDAANGTYYQLYSDGRGVCRTYEMSIDEKEWKLWREGPPFNQRFAATFEEGGDVIRGRWEIDEGDGWRTDFDLIYRRVS